MSMSVFILFILSCMYNSSYMRTVDHGNFESIVTSPFFVDKSEIVKAFTTVLSDVIMITAPRRFGKTHNMKILFKFFSITTTPNGGNVERNDTENFKIFAQNNLKIYQDTHFFNLHFGKYPTILLDFRTLACDNFDRFIYSFRTLIQKLYNDHNYLLESTVLHDCYKTLFNKFLDVHKPTFYELQISVMDLAQLLSLHFDKNCIILIDEFDAPIQKALINRSNKNDLDNIVKFLLKFVYLTLKGNRGFINSETRLGEVISAEAYNIEVVPFMSPSPFSSFYGLTQGEVCDLVNKVIPKEQRADVLDKVKDWYYGYKAYNYNIAVYNTSLVIQYLTNYDPNCPGNPQSYWSETFPLTRFKHLIVDRSFFSILNLLLQDFMDEKKGIHIEYMREFLMCDFIQLLNMSTATRYSHEDVFLNYLTDLGYFSVMKYMNYGFDWLTISIPNKVIGCEIDKILSSEDIYKFRFGKELAVLYEIPSHLAKLSKDRNSFIKLVRCISLAYSKKKSWPNTDYAFQRDIKMACLNGSDHSKKIHFYGNDLFVEKSLTSPNKKKLKTIMFIFTEDKGIILEIILEESSCGCTKDQSREGLKHIVKNKFYEELYMYNRTFNTTILIGLNLDLGKCTACYLVNSYNLTDAVKIK